MTKQKKNHDGKDAHVHSRLPFLRRKEEVEEQDDWHHTQLMGLLREDIKEIVKEQLAIEFIRMRQLLQKDLAEITRQFQNELRQTVMENMALLQEQVKETQQELWKLHLQQKELFREDLKEMIREEIKNSKIAICPKEEPLPEATKGTAAFQKITREQEMEMKYNDGCASLSSWASVKTDEVTVGQQSALQYKDFQKHIGENAKEMVHEQLENSELIVHPKPLTPGDFTLPPILHVSPPLSGPSRFIGPRDIQTLLEEESGPSNFLGPIINQTPLEKEDPEASKHLWRKRTQKHPDTLGGRGPRSTQTPLDQEDPGAPRHLWWKSGPRQFLEPRSTQTSLEEESLPRTQELPDTIGPRDLLLLPIRGKNGTTSMHK
ncbi:hypothetical protein STEG23_026050 [Scotinomys teguina]